jgi:prefoldin subunit 5
MSLDFDTKVGIGTIIEVIAFGGGGIWFVWTMKTAIELLTQSLKTVIGRLDKVDEEIDKLKEVVVTLAKQEERLAAQDKRAQELSIRLDSFKNTVTSQVEGALTEIIARRDQLITDLENRRGEIDKKIDDLYNKFNEMSVRMGELSGSLRTTPRRKRT